MFTENDVIKDASNTKNIADWMRFGRHVFNVNNLRSDISWSATSNKQIIGIVGYRGQSEVDYDRFFTQNDIVRFEVSMDDIFSCHFDQSS